MKKHFLLAPGPTPIPPEVLEALARPIIHHRTPLFEEILQEVREGLKYLFQTKNEVLIFASSGTGAMEGAVTNTLCAGDKALVVEAGKFGERFSSLCRAYGVKPIVLPVEWGQAVDPATIEKSLKKEPSIRAVFVQATETSTGVLHPVREIASIISAFPETILVVDGISHVGAVELPMDEWKLDVVLCGSQKALMLPPGLSFAALSDKAWQFVERSTLPRFYFDFKKELKNLTQNQSSYTPAISLVVGLAESLRLIRKEGLENVFARHARLARATRAAMTALGLQLYAPQACSDAVTAVMTPPGIDGQKVVKILGDKHNLTIAGGQDRAKGKVFRLAHMGYIDQSDILGGIAAVEMTLKELGYNFELGKGVRAAMDVLV